MGCCYLNTAIQGLLSIETFRVCCKKYGQNGDSKGLEWNVLAQLLSGDPEIIDKKTKLRTAQSLMGMVDNAEPCMDIFLYQLLEELLRLAENRSDSIEYYSYENNTLYCGTPLKSSVSPTVVYIFDNNNAPKIFPVIVVVVPLFNLFVVLPKKNEKMHWHDAEKQYLSEQYTTQIHSLLKVIWKRSRLNRSDATPEFMLRGFAADLRRSDAAHSIAYVQRSTGHQPSWYLCNDEDCYSLGDCCVIDHFYNHLFSDEWFKKLQRGDSFNEGYIRDFFYEVTSHPISTPTQQVQQQISKSEVLKKFKKIVSSILLHKLSASDLLGILKCYFNEYPQYLRDFEEVTPLDMSCYLFHMVARDERDEYVEVVKYLIEMGFNPNKENFSNLRVLDYVQNAHIKQYLIQHGATCLH